MKTKIILINVLIAISYMINIVHGGDCFQDPVYQKNYKATVRSAVNLRTVPCMEGSKVIKVLKAKEVVNAIAETDGWIQINQNGTKGWVGANFLAKNGDTQSSQTYSNYNEYDSNGNNNTTCVEKFSYNPYKKYETLANKLFTQLENKISKLDESIQLQKWTLVNQKITALLAKEGLTDNQKYFLEYLQDLIVGEIENYSLANALEI